MAEPRVAGFVGLLIVALVGSVSAHPLAPALLTLTERADGTTDVAWKRASLQVRGTEVRPVVPLDCPTTTQPVATAESESIVLRWTIRCPAPGLEGRRIAIEGLGRGPSDALVRLRLADGRVVQEVLRRGASELIVPESGRPARVLTGYLWLGVDHIRGGLDHLCFVAGLVVLAGWSRRLLGTVTAFTIGHSITLAIAALGVVRVPSAPVEVLIALSIFALAVELARVGRAPSTALGRRPWQMAAAFGLLHGLGFAGALREIGLPPGEVPEALFAFNVGIELGQLAFVGLLAGGGMIMSRLGALPALLRALPAYAIGSFAACWTLERLVGWLG